jgi:DNA-directed RNA polymerase sigma subunit (sigma70/sigma32)
MKNHGLKVLQEEKTCFNLHEKHGVCCERKRCNNWLAHPEEQNCAIIASKSGPKTLQEIGKIYSLTRMRICQIEKSIYEKIKDVMLDS